MHRLAGCRSRNLPGRIHHVRDATGQVTPNFHEALVSWNDGAEALRVLCNAHHPIVAFASPTAHEGDTHLDFVNCPPLAGLLDAGFELLTKEEACATIDPQATSELSGSELEQMRYWKPGRVGDVVFNYWD